MDNPSGVYTVAVAEADAYTGKDGRCVLVLAVTPLETAAPMPAAGEGQSPKPRQPGRAVAPVAPGLGPAARSGDSRVST